MAFVKNKQNILTVCFFIGTVKIQFLRKDTMISVEYKFKNMDYNPSQNSMIEDRDRYIPFQFIQNAFQKT